MATPAFNLVTEPWIPCRDTNGNYLDLSLEKLFLEAHDLRELATMEPPVTVAVLRLLLALSHRITNPDPGPYTLKNWKDTYKKQQFDQEDTHRYFNRWQNRFDLFDTEAPFYQSPSLNPTIKPDNAKYFRPISLIEIGRASGNNTTVWDHTCDNDERSLPPAEAARRLLAIQGFHLGGTVTREAGDKVRSSQAAPLTRSLFVHPTGANLFETLLLNLAPPTPKSEKQREDLCAWEGPPLLNPVPALNSTKEERKIIPGPTGILDYLTWQARRILLHPIDSSGRVDKIILMRGRNFPEDWSNDDRRDLEPYVPFLPDKTRGYRTLEFKEDKALWRDSQALFSYAEEPYSHTVKHDTGNVKHDTRPEILKRLSNLLGSEALPEDHNYSLHAYGVGSNQAKYLFWRHEQLPLPTMLLDTKADENEALGALETALQKAEKTGEVLQKIIDNLFKEAASNSKVPVSMQAKHLYWPTLDLKYRQFLEQLTRISHSDSTEDIEHLQQKWENTLHTSAKDALNHAIAMIPTHTRDGLPAIVRAEEKLQRALAKI